MRKGKWVNLDWMNPGRLSLLGRQVIERHSQVSKAHPIFYLLSLFYNILNQYIHQAYPSTALISTWST